MISARSQSLIKGPLVLCILDGWGIHEGDSQNAITLAQTPNWDHFVSSFPHSYLYTSGLDVGLPKGQMGNSEVGHMAIGSGRICLQDLPRIDKALDDGTLAQHPLLAAMIEQLLDSGKRCHLAGLLSPGGVHSHQQHILGLANIISSHGVDVYLHLFLDGRDTPPSSAEEYARQFVDGIKSNPKIHIATAGGRYYGMDRDKRWDRLTLAYDAMVDAKGEAHADILSMIRTHYSAHITDEFMKPAILGNYQGMEDGDAFVMANFRADRVRQLLDSLLNPGFDGFKPNRRPQFSTAIGMTEYAAYLNPFIQTLFPSEDMNQVLGKVLSDYGLTQLRIAETEKYAHVTFFFNGGQEALFAGEERIMIESPNVATYDLKPEMSAFEVADNVIEAVHSKKFDVVVVNFANTDMVGHSGILAAAIKAVEAVDQCIGRLASAVINEQGALLITADHGNAEEMKDHQTGEPHTAHTLNPVPFLVVSDSLKNTQVSSGRLSDIAPTVLTILGLPIPAEMTGKPLVSRGV
ncbi:MAG: 2,3-bisphosphoglycerate-independent phosphoglycerate mutase [Alphaproteobacteria bacterium]|nr:2,3-bisphosphoglycerate-independent phosphoglycerate mutase [Alphaproteobacteria bacterium]